MFPRMVPACSGYGSAQPRRAPSRSARCSSWAWDGPPARCAGCRSTRPGIYAPGRTATESAMPEPAPGRKAGRTPKSRRSDSERAATEPTAADAAREAAEEAALTLLSQGSLDIEGRLVDASNATMYCTVRHEDSQA